MDLMLLVADLKLQVADLIHEVAGLRMEVPELRPGEIRLNLTTDTWLVNVEVIQRLERAWRAEYQVKNLKKK